MACCGKDHQSVALADAFLASQFTFLLIVFKLKPQ